MYIVLSCPLNKSTISPTAEAVPWIDHWWQPLDSIEWALGSYSFILQTTLWSRGYAELRRWSNFSSWSRRRFKRPKNFTSHWCIGPRLQTFLYDRRKSYLCLSHGIRNHNLIYIIFCFMQSPINNTMYQPEQKILDRLYCLLQSWSLSSFSRGQSLRLSYIFYSHRWGRLSIHIKVSHWG